MEKEATFLIKTILGLAIGAGIAAIPGIAGVEIPDIVKGVGFLAGFAIFLKALSEYFKTE